VPFEEIPEGDEALDLDISYLGLSFSVEKSICDFLFTGEKVVDEAGNFVDWKKPTIRQVVAVSRESWLRVERFGESKVAALRESLQRFGLDLGYGKDGSGREVLKRLSNLYENLSPSEALDRLIKERDWYRVHSTPESRVAVKTGAFLLDLSDDNDYATM
jgi:hypothetical protein